MSTGTRPVPLLMKMTARRSLMMTAAREASREAPGRAARLYERPSGRVVVRMDRDDGPPEPGWFAAYRGGALILPGATADDSNPTPE